MKKSTCTQCGGAQSPQLSPLLSESLSNKACEVSAKKSHLSYWTPQTHRRANQKHHRSKRHHPNSHRKPELVQSMIYSHKKHQYYSPQLTRRKSEDFSYLSYQQIQDFETSDSSDGECDILPNFPACYAGSQPQMALLPGSPQIKTNHAQFSKQQLTQPIQGSPSAAAASAVAASRRNLQYYGGVHPVYLPNSRSKAQKLQKMPLLEAQHPIQQHCQGCCQNARIKTGDDKKCIIS